MSSTGFAQTDVASDEEESESEKSVRINRFDAKERDKRERSIVTIPNRRTLIKVGSETRESTLRIRPRDLESAADDLEYSPNTRGLWSVSFVTDLFGLSYAFSSGSPKDQGEFGKSKSQDFRYQYYGRQFVWGLRYQDYQGYYLEDSHRFDETAEFNNGPILLPDLKIKSGNFNMLYVLDPGRLSYRAAFEQTRRQKSFGASWIFTLNLDYTSIQNTGAIAPASIIEDRGVDGALSTAEGVAATVGAGGGFTLPSGPWYLTFATILGFGPQRVVYDRGERVVSEHNGASSVDMHIAAGYNGTLWVWGMMFGVNNISFTLDSERISTSALGGTFFLGRRFDWSI